MSFVDYTPTPTQLTTLSEADDQEPLEAATTNVSLEQLADAYAHLDEDKLSAPGGVVSGNVQFEDNVQVDGNVVVGGTLEVTGNATFDGDVDIDDNLVVGDQLNVGTYIHFTGAQPASNADPGANTAYALTQSKVLGHITTNGSGGVSVVDGFNIASVAIVSGRVEITFARAFASADYVPTLTKFNGVSGIVVGDYTNSTSGKLAVLHFTDAGASVDPSASALRFAVDIKGRQ